MFEIHNFAPLDTVGVENYIRYGMSGLRRYGTGTPEDHVPTPEHITITLKFQTQDNTLIFELDTLNLQRTTHIPNVRTLWSIAEAQLQLVWVWDFFRMMSFVRIYISKDKSSQQKGLLEAAQKLKAGDAVILQADNPSGLIKQQHILDAESLNTP